MGVEDSAGQEAVALGEGEAGAFRVSCSVAEVKANARGPRAARGGLLLLRVEGGIKWQEGETCTLGSEPAHAPQV